MMQQVQDFFMNLFGTESWPARWNCGTWTDFHGWLYILSDLAIWAAYFMIPFALAYFMTRKPNVPLPRLFWMFFALILLCGMTHLVDALIFYVPVYRVSALLRFLTAIASIGTVVAVYKFLPVALSLRTSKEFEEELAHRKRIEEQLEAQSLKLQSVNAELEQFAYVASHDLKEPLRTIKSSMELLQEELNHDDEKVRKILDFSQGAAARMQNLINNLLEFSQLGHRQQLEYVDLNRIVSEVKDQLAVLINETGATVKKSDLPIVVGNEQELHRLFQNLLNNAFKFRRKDVAPVVEIMVNEQENDYLFSVKDNGIGIQEDQSDKIFKIFQRLHNAKEYSGTGIGLAICKKIVELHNGRIWFESNENNGATFHFTLPKPVTHE